MVLVQQDGGGKIMDVYYNEKSANYTITLPKLFLSPKRYVNLYITCALCKTKNRGLKKYLFGEKHFVYKINCPHINCQNVFDGEIYTNAIIEVAKASINAALKPIVKQLNNCILTFEEANSLISNRLKMIEDNLKSND